MLTLRGTWMRGGTSKCWLFTAEDVAAAGAPLDAVLTAAFGAADPRQIDGVGGATSTTSKAAIIHRATDHDTDVAYAFAQVGIGADSVEWGSDCGNCATAIGLYAVQTGMVAPHGDRTTVRMRNINTGARLTTTVATPGGRVPESGAATVPGVHIGGVPVDLTYVAPAGTTTGLLLPTGNPVDTVESGGSRVPATLVDAGAPAALIDAAAVGWSATASIATLLPQLTGLRRAAALAMGLAKESDPVSHAVPKVGLVGPPADYRTTEGTLVRKDAYDLAVRMVSMHAPHPSIGLTSAVAIAAAAGVPGGVVARALPRAPRPGRSTTLRLGTPVGVVTVQLDSDPSGSGAVRAVTMPRAARRIAVAELYVPLGTRQAQAAATTPVHAPA